MPAVITYIILLIAFVLLLQAEAFTCRKKSRGLQQVVQEHGDIFLLNKKHFSCTVLLSFACVYWFLLPGLSYLPGFAIPQHEQFPVLIILSALAIILGYSAAKKILPALASSTLVIPAITSLRFILLRTPFLTAYEFFFRGVLLFAIADDWGESRAVTVNILLYILIHSFSGRKELIGAVPFGLLLCHITLWYQSIWPAIIIHLCLALSYDIPIIKNHTSSIKTIRL